MTLREEISAIIGIRIEPDQWKQAVARLDASGGFTRRHQMEILLALCERMEKLEQYVYTDKS